MLLHYTKDTEGTVKILNLSGELIDREQPKTMLKEIEKDLSEGTTNLLLNLDNLRYINSSGLTVLINVLAQVNNAGGKLALCNVNEKINNLLFITKLLDKFQVFENREAAIASFA